MAAAVAVVPVAAAVVVAEAEVVVVVVEVAVVVVVVGRARRPERHAVNRQLAQFCQQSRRVILRPRG